MSMQETNEEQLNESVENVQESQEESNESSSDLEAAFGSLKRENKDLKKEIEQLKSSKTEAQESPLQPKPTASAESERIERMELRLEGYSKEQVDEIMSFGGVQALKNEKISKYIATLGQTPEDKVEHAANMPSGAGSNYSAPLVPKTDLKSKSASELREEMLKSFKRK